MDLQQKFLQKPFRTTKWLIWRICSRKTNKQKGVTFMFNFNNKKSQKIISRVIIVVLILAMVVPMAATMLY